MKNSPWYYLYFLTFHSFIQPHKLKFASNKIWKVKVKTTFKLVTCMNTYPSYTAFFFYISDVSSFDTGLPLTTTPSVQLYSKLILVYIIFTFSLHIFSSAHSPRAFIPIAPLKMLLLRSPYKSPHSQIQRKVFFFISLDGLYSNGKSWPYPSLTWKFPWFPSYSTLLCFFLLSFALPFLSSPSPQIR